MTRPQFTVLLVQCHIYTLGTCVFSCNLPGNHASVYSVISLKPHIPWVHVCLAVSCQLHFGQPDQDLLLATAVTLGWNRMQIRVSTELILEKKFPLHCSQESNLWPFSDESGDLPPTYLSPPSLVLLCRAVTMLSPSYAFDLSARC